MYVGTVLTFVGGGVRALSTLPGLNQHMSQVGYIDRLGLGLGRNVPTHVNQLILTV